MTIEQEEARARVVDVAAQYQRDYRLTFGTQWGKEVLKDLANFCCAGDTTVTVKDPPIDTNMLLLLEGRRQVFLRIQRNLSLMPEQVLKLVFGQEIGDING